LTLIKAERRKFEKLHVSVVEPFYNSRGDWLCAASGFGNWGCHRAQIAAALTWKEKHMYKKIVVPVDMSAIEKGEKIIRKASGLLDAGGEIVLLNVVEQLPGYIAIDLPVDLIENAIKDGKAKLVELKERTGIQATVEIRSGPPAREILACAEEHHADLIIVASHTPDFTNYFIGATADRVVRHAKCSVLIDR
jgi:nucleotide-binding universal stress UspA family protein